MSNGRICVYNLLNDTILPRQLARNFAAKRYFYDITKEELLSLMEHQFKLYPELRDHEALNDPQFVEHMLGRSEGEIKNIFDEIEQEPELLNDIERRLKIAIFLHDLAYRTEHFRQQMEYINSTTYEWVSGFNIPHEQKEKMLEQNTPSRSKITQIHQIIGISPLLKTTEMLMNNYNWYFGRAVDNVSLVISDNPASCFTTGFNDICFPLSEKTAIIFKVKCEDSPILTSDTAVGMYINISQRSVNAYNCCQLVSANRFLFGDKETLMLLRKVSQLNGMIINKC